MMSSWPLHCTLSLTLLCWAVSAYDSHYMGGAMFFRVKNTSPSVHKFEVTALLSWRRGYGPCGTNCTFQDLGQYTNLTRELITNSSEEEYFGNWLEAVTYPNSHTNLTDGTDDVSQSYSGQVSLVSLGSNWEQEIWVLDVYGDSKALYKEITFKGDFWQHRDYAAHENTTFSVTTKLSPSKRVDTGLPNNSPVLLFQPLYRVSLNNNTKLRLTTFDADGDFVHCDVTRSISGSGPQPLPGVKVNRDCSIDISALTSDGYIDGGVGAVAVNVEDYSPGTTTLLGGGRNTTTSNQAPISSTSVQFMIQTVATLEDPLFVAPTFEDGHEFIAYVDSVVEIPLYAKPHPACKIPVDSFYIRSIPYRKYSVPASTEDIYRKSERVRYSTYTWRPQKSDVGDYIIGISVADKNGQTGLERHYVMRVKDLPLDILPHQDGPYFVYSPVGSTVRCFQGTSCSFSLYTATNNPLQKVDNMSLEYNSMSPPEVDLSRVTPAVVEGRTVYRTDVAITSGLSGYQIVCFKAHDDKGVTSKTECVGINLVPADPCASEPCGSSTCKSDGDTYECICRYGFTGRNCETDLKECASSPCVHGTCSSNPIAAGRYLCHCNYGWTGTNCETSTGTTNITSTTSSPVTSSTPPSPTCRDVSSVNCQTLDAIAGICSLSDSLTHIFCSRYCRLCHDVTNPCMDNPFVNCPDLDRTTSMCSAKSPIATLYCPRHCNYCTVPSTLPPPTTTTVKPTICSTCSGFECLFSAREVSCPLTQRYCRTVVTNTATGATSYTKSCAGSAQCGSSASGLTPHQVDCEQFDPMKKYFQTFTCSYCCGSDNCNGGGQTVPRQDTRVKITNPDVIG